MGERVTLRLYRYCTRGLFKSPQTKKNKKLENISRGYTKESEKRYGRVESRRRGPFIYSLS